MPIKTAGEDQVCGQQGSGIELSYLLNFCFKGSIRKWMKFCQLNHKVLKSFSPFMINIYIYIYIWDITMCLLPVLYKKYMFKKKKYFTP